MHYYYYYYENRFYLLSAPPESRAHYSPVRNILEILQHYRMYLASC